MSLDYLVAVVGSRGLIEERIAAYGDILTENGSVHRTQQQCGAGVAKDASGMCDACAHLSLNSVCRALFAFSCPDRRFLIVEQETLELTPPQAELLQGQTEGGVENFLSGPCVGQWKRNTA